MQPLDTIMSAVEIKLPIGISYWGLELDSIILHSKPITLEETKIVAELQRMFQRGDTVFFNAGAVEMPTGSVLVDLVRRMPGLRYDEEKGLTYNGRTIEEIRLNGDRFFQHDMAVALKNMPSDKIKYLKVYEVVNDTVNANSDKHLVMDMQTDKLYTDIVFANAKAGVTQKPKQYDLGGDLHRHLKGNREYSLNVVRIIALITYLPHERTSRTYVYASINDFQHNTMAGPQYEYSRFEDRTSSLRETMLLGHSQFDIGNTSMISQNKGFIMPMLLQMSGHFKKGINWNMNLNVGYRDNRSLSHSDNDTYTANPFVSGHDGELKTEEELHGIRQNSSRQTSHQNMKQTELDWSGGLSKRFGNDDAGIDMRVDYTNQKMKMRNTTRLTYYQLNDSVTEIDRLTSSPQDKATFSVAPRYNHRFGKMHHWGLNYTLTLNDDNIKYHYYNVMDDSLGVQSLATPVTDGLQMVDSLSYKSRNKRFQHDFGSNVTFQWKKYVLSASVNAAPTHQTVNTVKADGAESDRTYDAVLYSFSFNQSYTDSLNNRYGLRYDYRERLPLSMLFMNVTDYSDPLNIRTGSTSLHKMADHVFSFSFAQGFWLNFNSELTLSHNQQASKVVYDETTGRKVTSPVNINGNWSWNNNLNSMFRVFGIDVSYGVNYRFRHVENYTQEIGIVESVKSHVDYHDVRINLRTGFSNDDLLGSVEASYNLNSFNNSSRYGQYHTQGQFRLSGNLTYNLPWYIVVSTDCCYTLYHGYEMSSLNRGEFLLNLELSYKFLKSKLAELSLKCNDIFNQSRNITAQSNNYVWSESRSYGTTRYFLLSFKYRFNIMQ